MNEKKTKEEIQNQKSNDREKTKDIEKEKDSKQSESKDIELQELKNEIEILKEELQEAEKQNEEYQDRIIHLQADFENYKKRKRKEQEERLRKERERIIKDFIPIYDNLTRAIKSYEENNNKDSFVEGIESIYAQFDDLLNKKEIKPLNAEGEKFDPSKHEALMKVESDQYEHNEIVEEFERGYSYKNRILKPSKVKVNIKTDPETNGEEENNEE